MKKKNRKARARRKKEFRYHDVWLTTKKGKRKKMRHPSYIFIEKGNVFIYVSLTHSSQIKNFEVIKLRKNPNPKDNRPSYRVVGFKEDTKDTFGTNLLDWKIDEEDDKDINEEYKKR